MNTGETPQADPAEVTEVQETPSIRRVGQQLRDAREAKGLNVAEIAARLKLTQRQIAALEADEQTTLPSAIVRGFVRKYARLLEKHGIEWHYTDEEMAQMQQQPQQPPAHLRDVHARPHAEQAAARVEGVEVALHVELHHLAPVVVIRAHQRRQLGRLGLLQHLAAARGHQPRHAELHDPRGRRAGGE